MADSITLRSAGTTRENETLSARLAALELQLADTENRLAESQETLHAIQSGDVDAVVVSGRVFTLRESEHSYRELIEAMNEGAATLGADGVVLYCNQRLAALLSLPLQQITGNPVFNHIATGSFPVFEALLAQAQRGQPCSAELELRSNGGVSIPANISLRQIDSGDFDMLSMVVTNLSERRQWDQLIAAGKLSTAILDSTAEAIAVCDSGGTIIHANQELESLCGFNPLFHSFDVALPLELHQGPDDAGIPFTIADIFRGGTLRAQEARLDRKRGDCVSVLLSASAINTDAGIPGCVVTLTDITRLKHSEEELLRLNRTLEALSNSNQLLVRSEDEQQFLQQVCKVVSEDCGHAMVWIGVAEDDEAKSVRPVAHAGLDHGYLDQLNVTWDENNERGRGPTGVAIRTGQPASCTDMRVDTAFHPWRAAALERGYRSSLVIPLMADQRAFGAITIYSRDAEAFSQVEVNLLVELAADLAFGISTLRLRAAHAQAEKELRLSEERFRMALRGSPIVVFQQDLDLRYTWIHNPQLGYDDSKVIGSRDSETYERPEDAAVTEALKSEVIRTGVGRRQEVLIHQNGQPRYFDMQVEPTYDASGSISGIICAAIEITTRKQTEEALLRNADLLGLALAAGDSGFFDRDIVNDASTWSREMLQLHGFDSKTTAHPLRDWLDCIVPEDAAYAAECVYSSFKTGVLRGEWRIIRRNDGEVRWISACGKVLYDDAGTPVRMVGINTDITERKQSEKVLLRSEKLASVGRMASTIAHEINNPLETIGHTIYLAMTEPGTSPEAKSFLELAMKELERVTHITRQTLAFHRESKSLTLVNLCETVDSVLSMYSPRLRSRDIAVRKRYRTAQTIPVFEGEIRQLISNLLTNSMDAVSSQGRIAICISQVTDKNGAPQLRLTLADTGSGIPPELLHKVFEPFFTTKEHIGTGLGLWVTRQIAEKHSATIRVRSKVGVGTVFSIIFPISKPS